MEEGEPVARRVHECHEACSQQRHQTHNEPYKERDPAAHWGALKALAGASV